MVIRVLDHVPHCYTYADGLVIARVILAGLSAEQDVRLDFDGVRDVPSSFVNAAFVSLLGEVSIDIIRRHLKISNSTKQINGLIKESLMKTALKEQAFA